MKPTVLATSVLLNFTPIQSGRIQAASWGWSLASVSACASCAQAQGLLEWVKTMPGRV